MTYAPVTRGTPTWWRTAFEAQDALHQLSDQAYGKAYGSGSDSEAISVWGAAMKHLEGTPLASGWRTLDGSPIGESSPRDILDRIFEILEGVRTAADGDTCRLSDVRRVLYVNKESLR